MVLFRQCFVFKKVLLSNAMFAHCLAEDAHVAHKASSYEQQQHVLPTIAEVRSDCLLSTDISGRMKAVSSSNLHELSSSIHVLVEM